MLSGALEVVADDSIAIVVDSAFDVGIVDNEVLLMNVDCCTVETGTVEACGVALEVARVVLLAAEEPTDSVVTVVGGLELDEIVEAGPVLAVDTNVVTAGVGESDDVSCVAEGVLLLGACDDRVVGDPVSIVLVALDRLELL